jgi:sRNA-binding protein
MGELITIEQQAVLTERFDAISADLDKRIQTVTNMVVSDDNYKDAKKIRADVRKEAKTYADDFKVVKEQALAPWNTVEDAYKTKIRNKYSEADRILKEKIDEITDGIKQQKEDEVRSYFEEIKTATPGVDWLTYEDLVRARGLKVGMSDSMKGLKDEVKTYVTDIGSEIDAISRDEENGAQVMDEYRRNGFQYAQAVATVHDRIERARQAAEELERRKAERAEAEERARKAKAAAAIEDKPEPPVETTNDVKEDAPAEEPETTYTATFTVYGTMDQIKSLIGFMNENGIEYKQIKK